ncbi:DUF1772 domain-containing protein [Amycolatopsis sp. CA-230715]|uniref:DUF1772 domain-containing protein n=1 Tax=Amycolatopsis sp. CA-230715 TaxID=2745196 RepID=UPI001C028680|nr:DUF1772 domain-containing protein [Amycolatopsis sp. CA-230715]QWF83757.1 hypothetical protein HUW46_07200 [Amycolatopsis sp. CA-230715]
MTRKALVRRMAGLGQFHWFFGNLYEAAVDVPRLLADAAPNREPGLLTAGSPLRYYGPAAPVALAATTAALTSNWREGGDRRAVVAAAAGTATALALTAHLVRAVNLRLLRGGAPLTEAQLTDLGRHWHRANAVRLAALAVAMGALRRSAPLGPAGQEWRNGSGIHQ